METVKSRQVNGTMGIRKKRWLAVHREGKGGRAEKGRKERWLAVDRQGKEGWVEKGRKKRGWIVNGRDMEGRVEKGKKNGGELEDEGKDRKAVGGSHRIRI